MKKYFSNIKNFLVLILLINHLSVANAENCDEELFAKVGKNTNHEVNINCTKVKKQVGHNCWVYAGITYFENRIFQRTGKKISLSAEYHSLKILKIQLYRSLNDQEASIDTAGSFPYINNSIHIHGSIPEAAWRPGKSFIKNYNELVKVLRKLIKKLSYDLEKSHSSKHEEIKAKAWKKFNKLVDQKLGKTPEQFFFEGEEYTPQSFANKFIIERDNSALEIELQGRDFEQSSLHPSHGDLEENRILDEEDYHSFYSPHYIEVKNYEQISDVMLNEINQGRYIVLAIDYIRPLISIKTGKINKPQTTSNFPGAARNKYEDPEGHIIVITGYKTDSSGEVTQWIAQNSYGMQAYDNGFNYIDPDYLKTFLKTATIKIDEF